MRQVTVAVLASMVFFVSSIAFGEDTSGSGPCYYLLGSVGYSGLAFSGQIQNYVNSLAPQGASINIPYGGGVGAYYSPDNHLLLGGTVTLALDEYVGTTSSSFGTTANVGGVVIATYSASLMYFFNSASNSGFFGRADIGYGYAVDPSPDFMVGLAMLGGAGYNLKLSPHVGLFGFVADSYLTDAQANNVLVDLGILVRIGS